MMLDNIKYIEMSENTSKAAWNVAKYNSESSKPVKPNIEPNTLNQFLIDSVKDDKIERLTVLCRIWLTVTMIKRRQFYHNYVGFKLSTDYIKRHHECSENLIDLTVLTFII